MNITLCHNEWIYDALFKYFAESFEMLGNILKFTSIAGFIAFIFYICYRICERRYKWFTNKLTYNMLKLQSIEDSQRLFIRQRSIISHKEMLKALEQAADECYKLSNALKCIDIVVHCPQLINIKSLPKGLTPFHRVCLQGNKALISFMLAKGADPNITTITGENALCMAIYYFLNNPRDIDFSCLNTLVENEYKFGSEDKYYNHLLKLALSINHTKLVQWIILHHNISTNKVIRYTSMPLIKL